MNEFKQKRLTDLKNQIKDSFDLLNEYEEKLSLSSDPKEIKRYELEIKNIKKQIKIKETQILELGKEIPSATLSTYDIESPQQRVELMSIRYNTNKVYYKRNIFSILRKTFKNKLPIIITGVGGSGKSTLARHYLKLAENKKLYEKAIWIDASNGVEFGFVNNYDLIKDLKVKKDDENKFSFIINELNKVDKKSFIIIDNAQDDFRGGINRLRQDKWDIIITTKQQVNKGSYKLFNISDFFNQETYFRIFKGYYLNWKRSYKTFHKIAYSLFRFVGLSYINFDKKKTHQLLELISYHTLTIELFAKILSNDINRKITIDKLIEAFYETELNNAPVGNIEVYSDYTETKDNAVSILVKAFEVFNKQGILKLKDEGAKTILLQLSLLQNEYINLDDFVEIVQPEDVEKFNSNLDYLYKNGWVEIVDSKINKPFKNLFSGKRKEIKEANQIKLHRVLAETLLYQELNPQIKDVYCIFYHYYHQFIKTSQIFYEKHLLKLVKYFHKSLVVFNSENYEDFVQDLRSLDRIFMDKSQRIRLNNKNDSVNEGIPYNKRAMSITKNAFLFCSLALKILEENIKEKNYNQILAKTYYRIAWLHSYDIFADYTKIKEWSDKALNIYENLSRESKEEYLPLIAKYHYDFFWLPEKLNKKEQGKISISSSKRNESKTKELKIYEELITINRKKFISKYFETKLAVIGAILNPVEKLDEVQELFDSLSIDEATQCLKSLESVLSNAVAFSTQGLSIEKIQKVIEIGLNYYYKFHEIVPNLVDEIFSTHYFRNVALAFQEMGKMDDAIEIAELAVIILDRFFENFEHNKVPLDKTDEDAELLSGDTLIFNIEDISISTEHALKYNKSGNIRKLTTLELRIGDAKALLSQLYFNEQKIQESENFAHKALIIYNKYYSKDPIVKESRANLLSLLLHIYSMTRSREIEEIARTVTNEFIELINEYENKLQSKKVDRTYCLRKLVKFSKALGVSFLVLNNKQTSIEYFEKELNYKEELGRVRNSQNHHSLLFSFLKLSELHFNVRNYEKALVCAKSGIKNCILSKFENKSNYESIFEFYQYEAKVCEKISSSPIEEVLNANIDAINNENLKSEEKKIVGAIIKLAFCQYFSDEDKTIDLMKQVRIELGGYEKIVPNIVNFSNQLIQGYAMNARNISRKE